MKKERSCPPDEEISALIDEDLDDCHAEQLREHLEQCAACRKKFLSWQTIENAYRQDPVALKKILASSLIQGDHNTYVKIGSIKAGGDVQIVVGNDNRFETANVSQSDWEKWRFRAKFLFFGKLLRSNCISIGITLSITLFLFFTDFCQSFFVGEDLPDKTSKPRVVYSSSYRDCIFVTGYSEIDQNRDMVIWKFDRNGLPVSEFGGKGFILYDGAVDRGKQDIGYSIAMDNRGRLVVSGLGTESFLQTDMALWRCFPDNGSLDESFFKRGYVAHKNAGGGFDQNDVGYRVKVDDRDRIVVVGKSFVTKGKHGQIAKKGQIVAPIVWRYRDNGSLDKKFFGQGYRDLRNATDSATRFEATNIAQSFAFAGENIFIVGRCANDKLDYDVGIWHLDSSGVLVDAFDKDGIFIQNNIAGGNGDDFGQAIAIDDGKIVVAGHSSYSEQKNRYKIFVLRLNQDGSVDRSFGKDGFYIQSDIIEDDRVSDMAIDRHGRIVVIGSSHNKQNYDMAIWRLTKNGALDKTFARNGYLTNSNAAGGNGYDLGHSVAIDGDKIVVVGESLNSYDNMDMVIWRYNEDGTLDTTFGKSHKGIVVARDAAGEGAQDVGYSVLCN